MLRRARARSANRAAEPVDTTDGRTGTTPPPRPAAYVVTDGSSNEAMSRPGAAPRAAPRAFATALRCPVAGAPRPADGVAPVLGAASAPPVGTRGGVTRGGGTRVGAARVGAVRGFSTSGGAARGGAGRTTRCR